LIATRDLIREEQPDEIGVSVAYPLPGTLFYERVRAQLGRQRNWKDTGDLAMLFQGTFDTELYRRVRDILHDEVESGTADHGAWDDLENRVHLHRSPSPISLAVGT
jgi:anaerobic magnesium-protoporphyrin IX monomethyl ester cyclase